MASTFSSSIRHFDYPPEPKYVIEGDAEALYFMSNYVLFKTKREFESWMLGLKAHKRDNLGKIWGLNYANTR